MQAGEHLLALIGEAYDAALDAALWPSVLRKSADFVGGRAGTLFWKNAVGKSGNVTYDDGRIDPHYVSLYFEKYVKLDPATTYQFFAEIERPISTDDIMPYDEFLDTRFYKEWAQPQGLVDFVSAALDKSSTSAALFGVFRGKENGLVDDDARNRMRLIVPHIRRAVLIGRIIDLKRAEAASFADALDGLEAGIFLVDRAARIVHANAAGHTIVAGEDYLRVADGCLVATDRAADQILRDAFSAAARGDAALGIRGVSVPFTGRNGDHHVAHVLPLTSGSRRQAGIAYSAVAAVFVRRAALTITPPPEVIARHYRLTPTELRVLLAVVEVGGVPSVAETLGIAETTVKTHLSRLYEKTGAVRQADLVKLVAGFASPLLP